LNYVFDSAVIGRPGQYRFKLATESEGEDWLKKGWFAYRPPAGACRASRLRLGGWLAEANSVKR